MDARAAARRASRRRVVVEAGWPNHSGRHGQSPSYRTRTDSETWTLDLHLDAEVALDPLRRVLGAAELEELRHRRDAARAAAKALEAAIFTEGGGPAEQAAAAELATGTAATSSSGPISTGLRTHADWLTAEHTHDQHHGLLDQLDRRIDAAESVADDALAATYRRLRAELSRHTAAIIEHRDFSQAEVHDAQQALFDAAGGPQASSPKATSNSDAGKRSTPTPTAFDEPVLMPGNSITSCTEPNLPRRARSPSRGRARLGGGGPAGG